MGSSLFPLGLFGKKLGDMERDRLFPFRTIHEHFDHVLQLGLSVELPHGLGDFGWRGWRRRDGAINDMITCVRTFNRRGTLPSDGQSSPFLQRCEFVFEAPLQMSLQVVGLHLPIA